MQQLICPVPLSTSPSCGDPDCRLNCNNKVVQLKSGNGTLCKVLSIDPSSYSFVISPPSISLGSCISSDIMDGGLQSMTDLLSTYQTATRCSCSTARSLCFCLLSIVRLTVCAGILNAWTRGSSIVKLFVAASWRTLRLCRKGSGFGFGACTGYTSVVAIDENAEPGSWKVGIELQWLPVLA